MPIGIGVVAWARRCTAIECIAFLGQNNEMSVGSGHEAAITLLPWRLRGLLEESVSSDRLHGGPLNFHLRFPAQDKVCLTRRVGSPVKSCRPDKRMGGSHEHDLLHFTEDYIWNTDAREGRFIRNTVCSILRTTKPWPTRMEASSVVRVAHVT